MYLCRRYLSQWGALIIRAEIIPFEPDRVIPDREKANLIRIFSPSLHFINYLLINLL
jgi:hypothetical protein